MKTYSYQAGGLLRYTGQVIDRHDHYVWQWANLLLAATREFFYQTLWHRLMRAAIRQM
jgi:hypothetical protein